VQIRKDACNSKALPHLHSFCTTLPHRVVIMIYMTNTVCSLQLRQLWMYHAAIYWWITVRCITIQFPRQTETALQGFNKCSSEPQPVEWQILSCFITLLSYGLLKYTEYVHIRKCIQRIQRIYIHTHTHTHTVCFVIYVFFCYLILICLDDRQADQSFWTEPTRTLLEFSLITIPLVN
jgi:hypothetical protein